MPISFRDAGYHGPCKVFLTNKAVITGLTCRPRDRISIEGEETFQYSPTCGRTRFKVALVDKTKALPIQTLAACEMCWQNNLMLCPLFYMPRPDDWVGSQK